MSKGETMMWDEEYDEDWDTQVTVLVRQPGKIFDRHWRRYRAVANRGYDCIFCNQKISPGAIYQAYANIRLDSNGVLRVNVYRNHHNPSCLSDSVK